MLSKHKPLILIGGGGHASVLADILLEQGREIRAIISPENISSRKVFHGITHLTQDSEIECYSPNTVQLVNGIGMLPGCHIRKKVAGHFIALGYEFETVIASSAYVSPFARLGAGAQILPRTIIQTGVNIGDHSIINSGAVIEHDSHIDCYCHIAPNATICGQVTVKQHAFIGANATVIQGVQIGQDAVVGAGVSLTWSLPNKAIAYPSRPDIHSKTNS